MMRVKGAGSRTPRSRSHLPAMRGEKRFLTGVVKIPLGLPSGLCECHNSGKCVKQRLFIGVVTGVVALF